MASFFQLLSERNKPVEAIFAATDIAEENRVTEWVAAQKIQSVARMRRCRKRYLYWLKCITDMQRVFRSYKGRIAALNKRIEASEAHQRALLDYFATVVQSRFRGFRSRKWISDFYAQKRYIMEVTQKSEEVRQMAHDMHDKQRQQHETRSRAEAHSEYTDAVQGLHHLLSTATISGVFRPPMSLKGHETVFKTNIEEDLRQIPIPRRKFKPDLPPNAVAMTAHASVLDTLKANSTGGGDTEKTEHTVYMKSKWRHLPLDAAPPTSLQSSAPYDCMKDHGKLDLAVSRKLQEKVHGGKAFVTRKPVPPKPSKSIMSDDPYKERCSSRLKKAF